MFARARAVAAPSPPTFASARPLVSPRVQRKATLGAVDDAYEREADAVADRVTRMSDAGAIGSAPPAISRRCAACDDEKTVRTKRAARGDASAHDVDAAANVASRGGAPLPAAARARFEPRFGHDFSNVRVHADGEAANAARGVRAHAYTFGSHIVFGAGQYAPGTRAGEHLLAHELAHVVQQGGGTPARVRRKVAPEYVVDEPEVDPTRPGAPERVAFARNSATVPASEQAKIDGFKSGRDRTVDLELLGLATGDELALDPTLPKRRADAVDAELAKPEKGVVPFVMEHIGKRKVTAGTAANTADTARLRFNRGVEILRPTDVSLSPATPTKAPSACDPGLEQNFQDAKTMAFDWIDVTRTELKKVPLAGGIDGSLDAFFGGHGAATVTRVDGNLGLIRDEVKSLADPANHACADPKDPGCVGAIASNSGGTMKICASYGGMTPEDRARNLVHEAGHSTKKLAVSTGKSKADGTSDFSYRHERGIARIGKLNPDQALKNSDSYSMFLMTERVPMSITKGMQPEADPAPTGFAKADDAEAAQRALALAERWTRLSTQGLKDLHRDLRSLKGKPVPASVGSPDRLDKILGQVKKRFPPILGGKDVTGDDLTMLAGVYDRYLELKRLFDQPIAISSGAATAFTATAPAAAGKKGSLSLSVDAKFLAANERARARQIVDALIELVPTGRIAVKQRGDYGAFAEFVREMFQ
ncbi:eCIS core domain-containing protein [Tahibacter soli]|uniref:DUF4157 domain-containing protein n=1 Tax=Tahibacter soli TaxID=2983605 RepID=A0A9X3YPI0_9GAMM|nr:DUF4157 domain-containing protein [Tahibacter soli]MDC8016087.1 DUF4157 domain-containing protein [Tahibacter soli]